MLSPGPSGAASRAKTRSCHCWAKLPGIEGFWAIIKSLLSPPPPVKLRRVRAEDQLISRGTGRGQEGLKAILHFPPNLSAREPIIRHNAVTKSWRTSITPSARPRVRADSLKVDLLSTLRARVRPDAISQLAALTYSTVFRIAKNRDSRPPNGSPYFRWVPGRSGTRPSHGGRATASSGKSRPT